MALQLKLFSTEEPLEQNSYSSLDIHKVAAGAVHSMQVLGLLQQP